MQVAFDVPVFRLFDVAVVGDWPVRGLDDELSHYQAADQDRRAPEDPHRRGFGQKPIGTSPDRT
ncbi:hypothetical protein [Rhodococcus marinonascens]|uniref:hypothetical protein n=1 Tax=Rhodococcus marinonascens TaxID=38311 RepID=UPI000933DF93|nr:hypothetical protein [Rhodococcus marinonascens]